MFKAIIFLVICLTSQILSFNFQINPKIVGLRTNMLKEAKTLDLSEKVKNWKQKMRGVWFRDEYKINKPTIANFTMPIN